MKLHVLSSIICCISIGSCRHEPEPPTVLHPLSTAPPLFIDTVRAQTDSFYLDDEPIDYLNIQYPQRAFVHLENNPIKPSEWYFVSSEFEKNDRHQVIRNETHWLVDSKKGTKKRLDLDVKYHEYVRGFSGNYFLLYQGRLTLLYDHTTDVFDTLPFYSSQTTISPNGNFIAFVPRSSTTQLVLYNIKQKTFDTCEVGHPHFSLPPQWTPSGDAVVLGSMYQSHEYNILDRKITRWYTNRVPERISWSHEPNEWFYQNLGFDKHIGLMSLDNERQHFFADEYRFFKTLSMSPVPGSDNYVLLKEYYTSHIIADTYNTAFYLYDPQGAVLGEVRLNLESFREI